MKPTILLLFCILLSSKIIAQEHKVKFGEVTREELEMKVYPKDSSAEAVVLYDYGNYEYSFSNDIPHIIYKFHKRIKILKKSGLKWATFIIPTYYGSSNNTTELTNNIKGISYNLQNDEIIRTDLTKSSIFEEKTSDKERRVKFVLPQIKEGTVFEYSYEIDSPLWYTLKTWKFQEEIPVVWSELHVKIPGYFDYKLTYFGYNDFVIKKADQGTQTFITRTNEVGQVIQDPFIQYHFAMQDLPALQADDFMTTIEDYRSSIDFELARTMYPGNGEHIYSITYNDLTKTLLQDDNYGLVLRKFSSTADNIGDNVKAKVTSSDSLSIIKATYATIRDAVKWNGLNRLYATEKLDKIFTKQEGNSSEINLILVATLRKLGFDANPLILSTRLHGKVIKEIALNERFNYTVAHLILNNKDFVLDATDKFVKPNMLPKRCLNEYGWLLSKKPRWVSLIPIEKKQTNTILNFTIEDNQKLQGQFSEKFGGYAGSEKMEEINELGEVKFLEKLKSSNITFENPIYRIKSKEENEPMIECQTMINEAYTIAGNRIFILPLLWKTTSKNPFRQTSRNYPVDLGYRIQETVIANYTIPQNYSIESLPTEKALALSNNKGKFIYSVKQDNGLINIVSQVLLSKPIYSVEDYFNLREFFNQIIAKQNEQIVLKKNQ